MVRCLLKQQLRISAAGEGEAGDILVGKGLQVKHEHLAVGGDLPQLAGIEAPKSVGCAAAQPEPRPTQSVQRLDDIIEDPVPIQITSPHLVEGVEIERRVRDPLGRLP